LIRQFTLLFALAGALFASPVDATRYQANVRHLSSPEMRGRGTGTSGMEKAARFLAAEFRKAGIPPAPGARDYFQRFAVTTNARLGTRNSLSVVTPQGTERLKPGADFQPFNFSGTGRVRGEVVFAGYGITAPEYNYDDYAGLDVKGKVVLVVRHEPQEFDEQSVFAGKGYTRHAQLDSKAVNAKMHGAAGVLFVNDVPNHTDADALDRFSRNVGPGQAGMAFVQVTAAVAEKWLAPAKTNLKEWIAAVDGDLKPRSFPLAGVSVDLYADVRRESRMVPNVVAYLPGESEEHLIIGAHYDHLGMGEQSSMAPNEAGKSVHPGADDNASGTAGLIELAHYFKNLPQRKRGILFIAFTGEELGLLGSAYYAENPLLPLEKAVAMVNMDMIGRMKDDRIFVGGAGTGSTLQAVLDAVKPGHKLTLEVSDQGGYGASDHMSFYIKRVPVLFFFSGIHNDYHRPSDTWEKINHEGAARLLKLIGDAGGHLLAAEARPEYVRQADTRPQATASASMGGGGAWFGSVPDMSASAGGFRLADVRDGSPAHKAGMKPGDVVYEFAGKPVASLMEFTYVLRAHKPGDTVNVKWRRGGESMQAEVTLAKRP
jgi:hypothetical protein